MKEKELRQYATCSIVANFAMMIADNFHDGQQETKNAK